MGWSDWPHTPTPARTYVTVSVSKAMLAEGASVPRFNLEGELAPAPPD